MGHDSDRMFAFYSEHTSTEDPNRGLVSTGVLELRAGAWFVSCGDSATHFFIRGIFGSLEEAREAWKTFSPASEMFVEPGSVK